jgi:hypothetical protein
VTVSDESDSVSASGIAGIGETSVPAGVVPLPMTGHTQETMEGLFKAPLAPVQFNDLDFSLLIAQISIANRLMSSGIDSSTTFYWTQVVGQNLFDMFATFVADHGTAQEGAVTDIATGFLSFAGT